MNHSELKGQHGFSLFILWGDWQMILTTGKHCQIIPFMTEKRTNIHGKLYVILHINYVDQHNIFNNKANLKDLKAATGL